MNPGPLPHGISFGQVFTYRLNLDAGTPGYFLFQFLSCWIIVIFGGAIKKNKLGGIYTLLKGIITFIRST